MSDTATLAAREQTSVEALAALITAWGPGFGHDLAMDLARHLRGNGVRNPSDPLAPGRIKAAGLKAAANQIEAQAKHGALELVGNPPHHCVVCQIYRQVAEQLRTLAAGFEGGAPDA